VTAVPAAVVVTEYQPSWRERGRELTGLLHDALGPQALRVEHIGSTAVAAYARFKRRLAAAAADLDAYTEVKDPVVDLVIVVAEAWADSTGWSP
jgi:GrpB-like predicted nucleotidyltransferase (UPF0157 family)